MNRLAPSGPEDGSMSDRGNKLECNGMVQANSHGMAAKSRMYICLNQRATSAYAT